MTETIAYLGPPGSFSEEAARAHAPGAEHVPMTSMPAVVTAVETVDRCLGRVLTSADKAGARVLITADHGNCEQMRNADGSPHTAHTTNLVHCLYVAQDAADYQVRDGILADIAPTLLALLGLDKPVEMTGENLVQRR